MTTFDDLERDTKKLHGNRRSFLKWGAMAAGAAAVSPKSLLGQNSTTVPLDAENPEPTNVAALTPLDYTLENFADGQPPEEPIVEGEDIEITAHDFTQGLRMAVDGLVNLDDVVKQEIVDVVDDLDLAVTTGDLDAATEALHVLRHRIICYSFEIDLAVGIVSFSEATSYSETLIVLINFLISLRVDLIGVIYVFPAPQVFKILQIFEEYKVCLTVIQIQQFEYYLRFWLFILSIRFRWGWLGLRISIDILLIYISICLRVTIVNTFRVCISRTRSQLLLVQC